MKKLLVAMMSLSIILSGLSPVLAQDKKGMINLNTATKEQLVSIGIKEEMADKILELRKENESFVDIEELLDVEGMDAKQLRKLKKKLYVQEVAGCNC